MARKPARLERAGALTPRDRAWSAIRELAERGTDHDATARVFSAVEVHYLANLRAKAEGQAHIDSVADYLVGLARANPPYIALLDGDRPAGRKRYELALYTLLRDVGVDTPRVTTDGKPVTQGASGEQMWQAMKVLGDFDATDLAHSASTREHPVKAETAKHYCTWLARAGYLQLVKRAVSGHVRARYRFVRAMNTGARAPLITKKKEVIDANTGRVMCAREAGKGERS